MQVHNFGMKYIPKLEHFFVDNKQEPWYDSEPSADGKKKI